MPRLNGPSRARPAHSQAATASTAPTRAIQPTRGSQNNAASKPASRMTAVMIRALSIVRERSAEFVGAFFGFLADAFGFA